MALLSGCSLSTPVPQSGIQAPEQWNTDSGHLVWPQARWWEQYQQRQLSELIAQARTGNLDLATAASRLLQADAQLRQSGASLLPQLDGSASGRRSGGDGQSPGNSVSATLNASYEVDF